MERFFAAAAARIARWSPAPDRRARAVEISLTVRDACREARRRGRWASLASGAAECVSLMAAALGDRRPAARSPITAGTRLPDPPERMFRMLRSLTHDLRMALRALSAAKLSTAIALITLAVGIGVNTTVFSVLDATLFRPMPFHDADRLVSVVNFNAGQGFSYFGFSPRLIGLWRQQRDLFDRFEASDRASLVYQTPSGAELVTGASVTPGLFPMLGVTPIRGRYFVEGDGRGGTDRLVVVSYRFWRDRLGRRPDVLDTTISLNGQSCRVIGVMPLSFQYPMAMTEVWLPYDPAAPPPSPVVVPRALEPLARLAPGVTFERADLETVARGARLSEAAGNDSTTSAKIDTPARAWETKTVRSLTALGAAVGFLMLIVCANLASLSLSRSLARARDYAVRSALGASRRDIVRETFVENVVVGLAGIALGVAVAWVLQRLTVSILPDQLIASTANPIDIDARALGFTAIAGAIATLLFGLPPAVIASRGSVVDGLRLETRSSTGSAGARRWRSGLVIVEVGLSVVLLVGAALMARSLLKLQSETRGFDSENLLSMTIALPAPAYADATAQRHFSDTLVSTLRHTRGVVGVTLGGVPASLGSINAGTLEIEGQPGSGAEQSIVPARVVPRGYFATLRMPILDGHDFRDDDPDDAVIVSQAFAERHWPAGSAIGGRFRFAQGLGGGPGGPWRTVVGVVSSVRAFTDARDKGWQLYYSEGHGGGLLTSMMPSSTIAAYQTIVVRADRPATFIDEWRSIVHGMDPGAVIWKTELVDHLYADAFARPRVVFLMMATFASFALLLVAAGLYGVLSHLVAHRMREIGIRSALGATRSQIARLVVGQSLLLTLSGLAAGLAMAIPLVRAMRSLLYDVESSDPVSVVAVSSLLVVVALLATWRPARTAARVDPASLLRG